MRYLKEVILLFLNSLRKNLFLMHEHVYFLCLHLAPTSVTIHQNVFSNTVLSILRHVCFAEASFEPITFFPIFHPFVLNWPLQEQVDFRSWYLQRFNHDKGNNFPFINKLFRSPLEPSQKCVGNCKLI